MDITLTTEYNEFIPKCNLLFRGEEKAAKENTIAR
jgi:hypothetical protein